MTVSSYELNYCQDGVNLMIQKAHDGDELAVNKLAEEGGSLWDAVYGYAFGGHDELVKRILSKQPKLINAAATGYARAQNFKETAKFNGTEELKPHLIYGFALAGDEMQIRAALNSRGGTKYLPLVIEGLASTNQASLLFELVTSTYFPKALKAAAKSGHHELVKGLLDKLDIHLKTLNSSKAPLPPKVQTALGYVLEGYSEGRHFPEAAEILELGINPMFCLNALATSKRELDTTDASLLLSTVTQSKLKGSLKALMETQCGLKPEKLDLTLKIKPISEQGCRIKI